MNSISFIDTEVHPVSGKLLDIGAITNTNDEFHSNSLTELERFLSGSNFICGHNIFKHDLKHIQSAIDSLDIGHDQIIDTLFLSPLLFPESPYHKLVKDDKLQTEELSNPLNDAIKCKDLFLMRFLHLTACLPN